MAVDGPRSLTRPHRHRLGRAGFGESSDIHHSWRVHRFADALAAFVASLGLEQPHLVGHSFGTMVALSLFQRHPTVPASLVLIGGYAGWAGSLPPDEVARRREMFVGIADLGEAFDPKSYPGLFSDLIPADRDAALATMMRGNIRPATIRAAGYIGAERPTSGRYCQPSTCRRSSCTARRTPDRRSPTPRRFMRRSRPRNSWCFHSSAMHAWSRTPTRVQQRSAGS